MKEEQALRNLMLQVIVWPRLRDGLLRANRINFIPSTVQKLLGFDTSSCKIRP